MERCPDDFFEVWRAQLVEQDRLPHDERVFIGGDVVAYMMQFDRKDGRSLASTPRFQKQRRVTT